MQGGFIKFRKRQSLITLINSLIMGIAAALLAVGVLFLISKLNNSSVSLPLLIGVPAAAFVAAGAIYGLCTRQSDKKLARRIDEEFAFNDRAKTMVEYKSVQTDMVRLQREDAQSRLEGLPTAKLKWKGMWTCLVTFVCALAIFATGLALPKKKKTVKDPTPPPQIIVFEITLAQRTQLGNLIKSVEESKAEEAVRTAIVTELKGLQLKLDEFESWPEVYAELARIITAVDEFVEEYNTYKRVYAPIRNSEMETVQQFAIGIGLNGLPDTVAALKTAFEDEVAALATAFENEENYEEEKKALVLVVVNKFLTELKARYAEITVDTTDGLMVAVKKFIADLEAVVTPNEAEDYNPLDLTYEQLINHVDRAMNDNIKPISDVLAQQTENRKITSDAIKNLITIFDMPADWIPDWGGKALDGLDEGMPEPEDPTKPGEGIIIDGVQYPSAEKVYDYFTKVICEYGKVFEGEAHNYKAAVNMLIAEGVENGTISPELEEMIRSYLDEISGSDPIVGGN